MGHGIQRKPGASTLVARHEAPPGSVSPGKRTLTEQLGEPAHEARPIQRKALGDAQLSRAAVQAQVDRASGDGGYIPWAAEHVEELIDKERGSAPGEFASRVPVIGKAIGHVVDSNLDAVGDPSRENQILRNQELDRATGRDRDGGRVEPSFTIKRF